MKFLLAIMTAMLIAGAASAQHGNEPKGHMSIGIKGGVNLYNIHNDNNTVYNPKVGFNAGLLGHIHLTKHFALQPEIQYSAQGAKYDLNNHPKINLGYINVPVLLQYMWNNGFRLQAGPQAGLLISANTKVNETTADMKDEYRPLELGVSFGAGYIHPATGIGIDARYNMGLTNINETGNVNSTNRGFQLSLFYIFSHNSKIGVH